MLKIGKIQNSHQVSRLTYSGIVSSFPSNNSQTLARRFKNLSVLRIIFYPYQRLCPTLRSRPTNNSGLESFALSVVISRCCLRLSLHVSHQHMSHLHDIIEIVKTKGKHEESWNILLNAYFRGDDGFEKVRTWASSVGLSVIADDKYQTFIFRKAGGQPTQPPRA